MGIFHVSEAIAKLAQKRAAEAKQSGQKAQAFGWDLVNDSCVRGASIISKQLRHIFEVDLESPTRCWSVDLTAHVTIRRWIQDENGRLYAMVETNVDDVRINRALNEQGKDLSDLELALVMPGLMAEVRSYPWSEKYRL